MFQKTSSFSRFREYPGLSQTHDSKKAVSRKKKEREAMNYPVGLSIENSLERKGEKNLRLV